MASNSLDPYQAKRDFDATPEPRAGRGRRRGAPVFVIHRHDARNLHFDLRLEMDGVLKSWAVPKGFSYEPKDKKLAVRTEDHPIEYEDFHGLIPSGQYGAGVMTIWDKGTYELLTDVDGLQQIDDGKIELRLDGGRLRGEWHMVKLKDDPSGWLLFKAKDRYSRASGDSFFAIDIHSTERSAFPRQRKPMLPASAHRGVLEESGWLYEPRLPGFRVFVEKKLDNVRIRSDRGRDLAPAAPRLARELEALRAENALLDGVCVSLNSQGRPDVELTRQIIAGQVQGDLILYVFDLLYYDAWDLRTFPLSERKAALISVLGETRLIQYVDHERTRPAALLTAVTGVGMDALIAKRADSSYVHGASPDWTLVEADDGVSEPEDRLPPQGSSRVSFSNRGKVLWPNDGYTKGDLIDYYDRMAELIVRYLSDRPLSLHRFPDGIDGQSFFQKGAPGHTPDWIRVVPMDSSNKEGVVRFVVCDERDTLLYLGNLAALELHPWQSRCGSPGIPDWAILDLDPYGAPFENIVQIAATIGEILRDAGLRPLLKTSGSKGLHIYIPLLPHYTYDHVRMFCEGVARLTVFRHPEIATVERTRSERVGQVYVDFLQNRRGQTVAAPYSVRPVPGAQVATPLHWHELGPDLHPSQFTIATVPDRVIEFGDLFADACDDPQDLLPAIDAIREMLES